MQREFGHKGRWVLDNSFFTSSEIVVESAPLMLMEAIMVTSSADAALCWGIAAFQASSDMIVFNHIQHD